MEEQTERIQQLHNAALEGDVPCLLNLLHEDRLILDRCTIEKSTRFKQSPLHVAANAGNIQFAKELLQRKPEYAGELDESKCSSPLHLASARGHLEIVQILVNANPSMCFARDRDGRNPIHVAAMNEQIPVLEQLYQAMPRAALGRTKDGETVLHLCVKYGRPDVLEFMVKTTDDGELLNSKDGDGNTALHLAVYAKQPKTVKFLLEHKKVKKDVINANGSTAMDVFFRSKKHANDKIILHYLKSAKASKAKDTTNPWLENKSSALMVVASLIATMAFQVGISPPGGTWQDETDNHTAGEAIISDDSLLVSNTIALFSSLSVILLLISGLPRKQYFVVILMGTMWIAISATVYTYSASVDNLSYVYYSKENNLYIWFSLMFLLLLSHAARIIIKVIKKWCAT